MTIKCIISSVVFQATPLNLTQKKKKKISAVKKKSSEIRTILYIHIYIFIHLFIISKTSKNVELSLKGKGYKK